MRLVPKSVFGWFYSTILTVLSSTFLLVKSLPFVSYCSCPVFPFCWLQRLQLVSLLSKFAGELWPTTQATQIPPFLLVKSTLSWKFGCFNLHLSHLSLVIYPIKYLVIFPLDIPFYSHYNPPYHTISFWSPLLGALNILYWLHAPRWLNMLKHVTPPFLTHYFSLVNHYKIAIDRYAQ